jgi:hypothetical protein
LIVSFPHWEKTFEKGIQELANIKKGKKSKGKKEIKKSKQRNP